PEERLRQGLEQAVARGTLLRIDLRLVSEGSEQAEIIEWYFFNTPRSRKVVDELQGGEMVPVRMLNVEQVEQESEIAVPAGVYNGQKEPSRNVHVQVERPNIFVLYEQNIGLLSPLIADQLKDAADQYPPEWIEAAFRQAVQQNKRKCSYISAILTSWETEGRQVWNA